MNGARRDKLASLIFSLVSIPFLRARGGLFKRGYANHLDFAELTEMFIQLSIVERLLRAIERQKQRALLKETMRRLALS